MSTNFFNSINLSGADLKRETARAATQEKLILNIFKANPEKKLSPSQIHEIFTRKYQLYPPITSIRRAMTNLSGGMGLQKTDEMIKGLYNLPEHTWKLSTTTTTKTGFSVTNTHPSKNLQINLFDHVMDTPID
jgi:hypothetical protein